MRENDTILLVDAVAKEQREKEMTYTASSIAQWRWHLVSPNQICSGASICMRSPRWADLDRCGLSFQIWFQSHSIERFFVPLYVSVLGFAKVFSCVSLRMVISKTDDLSENRGRKMKEVVNMLINKKNHIWVYIVLSVVITLVLWMIALRLISLVVVFQAMHSREKLSESSSIWVWG